MISFHSVYGVSRSIATNAAKRMTMPSSARRRRRRSTLDRRVVVHRSLPSEVAGRRRVQRAVGARVVADRAWDVLHAVSAGHRTSRARPPRQAAPSTSSPYNRYNGIGSSSLSSRSRGRSPASAVLSKLAARTHTCQTGPTPAAPARCRYGPERTHVAAHPKPIRACSGWPASPSGSTRR